MKTEATQMKDVYAPAMTPTKRKISQSQHETADPKASSNHSSERTPTFIVRKKRIVEA